MKKHTGKFNVKLYRYSGKPTVDQFSLVFPYPKWLRERDKVDAFCIGCSQASDGTVIRCDSFAYNRKRMKLGTLWKLESMSPVFQQWARTLEILWHDALKYDDEEHWDAFAKA